MNLQQRCQAIFKAGYEFGKTSFRCLAKKTKLSKSSVHRLYHRIASRNQHPESSLWETEAGQKWLRLLVLATIFIFALRSAELVVKDSLNFFIYCDYTVILESRLQHYAIYAPKWSQKFWNIKNQLMRR